MLTHNLHTLLAQDGTVQDAHGPALPGTTSSASAILTFKNEYGDARVQVAVSRLPVPVSPLNTACPDRALHPYSRCTTREHQGATLTLDSSPADESRPLAAQRRTAALTFPDGRQVVLSESALGQNTGAAAPRSPLPLTLQKLTEIAGSPTWRPLLAALPEPPHQQSALQVDQTVPAHRITGIATRSLPRTMRVADQGGLPGYGHLTVDDGHGKCLVTVTVQRWKPRDATIRRVFERAEQLPDGTRIMTSRSTAAHGGRGAVEWRVDTLSRDGLRVVVNELNTSAYRLPATRTTPALTVRQLTDIARSGSWRTATDAPS
ncbi:hypothetical protein IAG44_42795 [Streptomyces roseirectus]|uniref:Uncharacterized protein n=1 Tax=Streptomyces roseirectus TaxID=2768066 RepID=A0A7H0IRR0_9ACTN|nr:hypothetical protein [Streptomyces roseirectus]QNP75476.1 hypothetical protein IAG44_42795 [Streptomyces roseirectus]